MVKFPWSPTFQAWDVSLLVLPIFVRARQSSSQCFQLPRPPKLTPRVLHMALPQSPREQLHTTFLEDSWTLLSFPTDSPVMAVLPCSKCSSQNRLINSSSPSSLRSSGLLSTLPAAGVRVQLFVWWILLLQSFGLRPPICFPERDYEQAKCHTNLLCIIPEKTQLSKPMTYLRRDLVHQQILELHIQPLLVCWRLWRGDTADTTVYIVDL